MNSLKPALRALGVVILAVVVFQLVTTTHGSGPEKDGWEVLRAPAQDFELRDLEGRVLKSKALSGRIVIVDFWATWCSPCIRELPELQVFAASLEGRKDVAFLSFSATEEPTLVQGFVKKKGIAYPVYLADDLVGPYEVNALPTKVVIDMRGGGPGVVRFRRDGFTEVKSIEARLDELLHETGNGKTP